MATFPGMQADLSDLLHSLVELDYDAIDAYTIATGKVDDAKYRTTLEEFRADHIRHVHELGRELRELGHEPPTGADLKSVLTQGRVVLGTISGDKGILKAMRSNERDTNRAYERALQHSDLSTALAQLLSGNLADERRHLHWLEDQLTKMGELAEDERITPVELPR